MEHKEIKEKIHAYYDGELPEEEAREVRGHLQICQDCRQRYENWEKIAATFLKAPVLEAPPLFAEKVMARLREEAEEIGAVTPERNVFRWILPAMGILFGSLLFLTVFFTEEQTPLSASDLLAPNMGEHFSMEALF